MKIAEFSVKNSLFINLISLLILVIGVISMYTLNREAFPVIEFDEVAVQTIYPGAPAEDVEKLVTTLLETELREVDDIEEMLSISREGLSAISLKMDSDIDENDRRKIVNDIQKAVDRVTDLPRDIEDRPVVIEINSKIFPVINIGLSGNVSEFELQNIADDLKDQIEEIDGVAKVSRQGYRDQEFWVEPDLKKMSRMHVSIEEIMAALKDRNITVPAGTLKTANEDFVIKTTGEFTTKEEIGDVIIRANDAGNWLRVKDIAFVRFTFEDQARISKNLGEKAVLLYVYKKEKGDAINVVDNTYKVLKSFKQNLSKEVQVKTYDDMSYYIKRRLNVLRANGIIGFIMVTLILFAFLHSRPAIFTAIGIPMAMATTLGFMHVLGLTINLMTMFGLIIVVGMIVDDGIIIAENVYRYLEKGLSPKEAAIKGTGEVIAPVAATIITTIAAFFPLMYMGGILGKFLRYIPLMVIVALCASVLEAFFILPSHLAEFLKPAKTAIGESLKTRKDIHTIFIMTIVSAVIGALAAMMTGSSPIGVIFLILLVGACAIVFKKYPVLDAMIAYYKKLLETALSKRYAVAAGITGVLLVCLFVLVFVLPKAMFSGKGIEEMIVRAEAPIGTPLEKTNEMLKPVEELFRSMPEKYIQTFITTVGSIEAGRGMGDPNAKAGSHVAQIHVYLTPMQTRDKGPEEIMADLRPELTKIKGFEKLYFYELKEGPPVGRDIEFNIRGDDLGKLRELAVAIKQHMQGFEGVSDAADSLDLGNRELRIVVDREKAKQAQLGVRQIALSMRNAFEGGIATSIRKTKAEEEINVRVRVPDSERTSQAVFDKLSIPNARGNLVPLKQVAHIELSQGLRSISHLDGKRYIQVGASVNQKVIKSEVLAKKILKKFDNIAKDYPGYSIRLGGEEKENREAFKDLMISFLIAVLAIFMILATLFKSLIQPFIVMLAIPFALIGVVVALLVHGESLGLLAFIGIVGLAGIVVNDSIVLVDFINKLRREGVSRRNSIVQSGVLRFRPVMLTTLTTVAGLSTVAYGIGGFDPFLRPMALSISWGLAFATGITLVAMPCFYAIIDDITQKIVCHPTVRKLSKSNGVKCEEFDEKQ
ncbi:MAG: efflux RND transporter permease subunit [Candidatus Omnitrophica bacterium]|nr:efflux RND transporter permease subunit [Candidatus Omnitrophota bacterium]